ncbi:MAG: IMP dehydrogenase [Saprospiraceae bacterium]|jgi:IMP dehydrogenase|uniref:IMP dehydrogenase n=1 Tax=Candidatus Brachybacter algidus TaxID=2982024 RepID=UPI001D871110|nr:IMP dehydrogenase [Candidatus Brachybacter algidus]HQW72156.1 IMP dehydrogenase [Saprospiraceae bacterium]MBK6374152.1 IMP dehydrogenase [Candidatus Brachybacter algidus]MBK6450034.1 IMP dehydrogenase [Candidatus Brachybacter algidus]MBK7604088.1 IMP dehydrogenase [Candidatus Brachybacter algidus]MBK8353914.1 IMP dehydrogenase [Candidatus Brachybacter algidus]
MDRINSFKEKFVEKGLTFDDVLLLPAHSEVLPRDVNTSTKLTETITINVPIISAAMDTVTEKALAISMARQGGIGIIHKNMSIESQAAQVRSVKRSESGMIIDPVTLPETATIADALQLMEQNKIGGIPIIDANQKLKGILTNRDLRFETSGDRPVTELMTKERLIIAPVGTDLTSARNILQTHKIEKLPVVDEDGRLAGLITYRDILKLKDFPSSSKDSFGRLLVGAAVGVSADTEDRINALISMDVDVIVIDTAHGHSQGVINTIKLIRNKFPNIQIIAGNVATGEGAKALASVGINGIKVGIGPGSICTTRIVTGVGVPQLTAIYNVSRALEGSGIPVIGDGGIRYTGDIVKAIAAGADTVMLGSLFAGVEESPGETIILDGRKFKTYRGMGSLGAMQLGSKDRYFQDVEDDIKKLVPEGIEGMVPYKGSLSEVIYQYIGGLRAGMGYCGSANIEALKRAQFVQISSAGVTESHPHNINITKESPNYSRR